MSHPAIGRPPSDATAAHPALAQQLLAAPNLPARSLEAALQSDPTLGDRYDERMLRYFLRDYDGHIKQLARALATGEQHYVAMYGETLVPVYRQRGVRMNDVVTLLEGLREAACAIVPGDQADPINADMDAWIERMRHHRRLAGDHKGNKAVRFLWKGAGLGDDSVV